jgi:hypothetical protein
MQLLSCHSVFRDSVVGSPPLVRLTRVKEKTQPESPLEQHHREMARASAAALQQQYQEAIDIVAELLVSGVHQEIEKSDPELARRLRAEARLLLGTALHYNDASYEDITKVLNLALNAPPEVAKDVLFTLAVVHLSFDHVPEAADAMRKAMEIIEQMIASGNTDPRLNEQAQEAKEFFQQISEQSREGVQ